MIDQDAVRIYLEMLEENQDDVSTRFSLACAFFRLEAYESAREQFEKIAGGFPDSLEAKLSRDWLDRIYRLRSPGEKEIDFSVLKMHPLSVVDIVSKKTTRLTRDNYCFFHTEKEKKFACGVCGKSLCTQCASLRKGKVLCPECIAKGMAGSGIKAEKKLHPLLRGVYSGLLVSFFFSLLTANLQKFGVGMAFAGMGAIAPEESVSFFVLYFVHFAHFSVLCALAGMMCQYYEKLSFLKCAEFSGRVGIGFGILFALVSGAETVPEFAVPLFQFWFTLFLSGIVISFINNALFLPMDEVRVRG